MVDVMPTDVPGMQFSSKSTYYGCKIYFGVSDSECNDLLLVVVKGVEMEQEEAFELIPPRVFSKLLKHFINDYSH